MKQNFIDLEGECLSWPSTSHVHAIGLELLGISSSSILYFLKVIRREFSEPTLLEEIHRHSSQNEAETQVSADYRRKRFAKLYVYPKLEKSQLAKF